MKDKKLTHNGNEVGLFSITAEMLDTVAQPNQPMSEIKRQVNLADTLRDCEGECSLSPEDRALIRSVLERSSIVPRLRLAAYDAFGED